MKGGLSEAKAADVPVIGISAPDCPEQDSGEALFAAPVNYLDAYPTYTEFIKAWGALRADWVVGATDGAAKTIIATVPGVPAYSVPQSGFDAEFAKCEGCEVVDTIKYSFTDFGPGLQQKTEQALLQQPDANALVAPTDSELNAGGMAAGVRASGRSADVSVMGGEGAASTADLIREGTVDAVVLQSNPWSAYAGADVLNRVFAGEDTDVQQGLGFLVVDQEHNLPESGPIEDKVDFRAAYAAVWGGS
jgi:ribose transport system substrate-binding protein